MKKIKLKLEQLNQPEILTDADMKRMNGGNSAMFCYTGMSCEMGGTCYSTMAGNNCVCGNVWGYGSSVWCG